MPTIVEFSVLAQNGQTVDDVVSYLSEQLKDENSLLRKTFPDIDLEFGVKNARSAPNEEIAKLDEEITKLVKEQRNQMTNVLGFLFLCGAAIATIYTLTRK